MSPECWINAFSSLLEKVPEKVTKSKFMDLNFWRSSADGIDRSASVFLPKASVDLMRAAHCSRVMLRDGITERMGWWKRENKEV